MAGHFTGSARPPAIAVAAARLRGTHRYSFRSGEWAQVLGVRMVTPVGQEPRAAFAVVYPDGVIDYVAVSDSLNYELAEA